MLATKFPSHIKSKSVYLEALKIEDAIKLFNIIDTQRDYIGKHLDWVKNVKTLDDEINYITRRIEGNNNLKEFNWCIFKNDTNELLGYIGTDPVTKELYRRGEYIDWENEIISFGYFLSKNATGHGYMTEALSVLKNTAVKLGFKRIEINSEAANIKSQKVAERCGFTHDLNDQGKMYFENIKNKQKKK